MTMPSSEWNTTRRDFLSQAACGFGGLALTGLLHRESSAAPGNPLAAKEPMFPARAKRIIFLFMGGGPSHVDTFDYKPELDKHDGSEIDFTGVRFDTFGKKSKRKLLKPLWSFQRHGECGQYVSELFPHVAKHVDKLCMIHSMHTEGVAHGPSTLFLHTGATGLVRPSMGSWVTYGLGSLNDNVPGFVTLNPSPNQGGPRNYSNAFLPAIYQGTTIGRSGMKAVDSRIHNIENHLTSPELQKQQFDYLQSLNRLQQQSRPVNDRLEATIDSFELAYRMQLHAPGIMDLSTETEATLAAYGVNQPETEDFGRQCLMARRLAEADVRYIQVCYSDASGNPKWDQHSNMPKHAGHAKATDQPVAALLEDLDQRGLLKDTLVWWGGEFGRTPFSQGNDGRDHNPRGFTIWLAGAGTKPGFAYGTTDEIGHVAVENKVHMHDLHATILHLLGLDHEKLTYRHAGRDFRLTDVHGRVVHDLLA
ncbi:MAG: sulfatase [Planctomyces sp.]|nr:sulfatase [Planctomyces sp.]